MLKVVWRYCTTELKGNTRAHTVEFFHTRSMWKFNSELIDLEERESLVKNCGYFDL